MPFPDLAGPLATTLAERGYAEPTPVQSAVLEAQRGRDLLVSAQTGSGKSVAINAIILSILFYMWTRDAQGS